MPNQRWDDKRLVRVPRLWNSAEDGAGQLASGTCSPRAMACTASRTVTSVPGSVSSKAVPIGRPQWIAWGSRVSRQLRHIRENRKFTRLP
jgi:hypothetical protein